MMNTISIQITLPTLNEYIQVERGNKFAAAKLKKQWESDLYHLLLKYRSQPIVGANLILRINWYVKDNRQDADNIVFAKKFLMDALVKVGILSNDSRKYIVGFTELVIVDKQNPRIEILY